MSLLRTAASWIGRHLLLLLLVLLMVVWVPRAVQAYKDYIKNLSDVRLLDDAEVSVRNTVADEKNKTIERVRDLGKAASDRIRRRIDEIDQELTRLGSTQPVVPGLASLPWIDVDALKDQALRELRTSLLRRERSHLEAVVEALDHARNLRDAEGELERRRRAHEKAYGELQANEDALRILIREDTYRLRYVPGTDEYKKWHKLLQKKADLSKANTDAAKSYDNQKRLVESLTALKKDIPPFHLSEISPERIVAPLQEAKKAVEDNLLKNPLGKAVSTMHEWLADMENNLPKALVS